MPTNIEVPPKALAYIIDSTHPQRKDIKSPTFRMALRSPLLLVTILSTRTQDPGVATMWIEIASITRSR
nr:hypothetical protein Q903MT_gene1402 [Picea sitchensis]